MKTIIVLVGLVELTFNVAIDDYNQLINEQMPNDKVSPTYNFLSRTVADKSRDEFKKLVVDDNVPNGIAVMQIAGVITDEMGGALAVSVKKQKTTPRQ